MQKFSRLKRFIVTTAMVAVAMAYAAPSAQAAFVLTVVDGGPPVSVTDNGPGDLNPTAGMISGAARLAGGRSSSTPASRSRSFRSANPDVAELDLVWGAVASPNATPLLMSLTDTGYTAGLGQPGVMTLKVGGTQPSDGHGGAADGITASFGVKDGPLCHNVLGGPALSVKDRSWLDRSTTPAFSTMTRCSSPTR